MQKEIRHAIKDDRWHVLNRPGVYIGATVQAYKDEYILENGKMVIKPCLHVPALIKIINEIIDNSTDILQTYKNGKVDITIDIEKNKIVVSDNGPGMPIQTIKDLDNSDILVPAAMWGKAKAGSNFVGDDVDAVTIGTNGVGSYCTNVFSTKFIGTTCNGSKKFTGVWLNNAESLEYTVTDQKKNGTTVEFYPDLIRFTMAEPKMNDDTLLIIRQRIINLSSMFENIKFTLNGEEIKYTKDVLLKAFIPAGEYYITDKYAIAIGTSDENDFKEFSLINGLNIKTSSAIKYIMKYVVDGVKDKLPKKYEEIKPGDIKTKLQIVMVGNKFPDIVWDGQTKEKLDNSDSDIRHYLGNDWKDIIDKVVKNKDIMNPITMFYDIKKEVEDKASAVKVDKEIKTMIIPKLSLATKKKVVLALIEGDSAKNGIMNAFGREYISYLPGKGVIMNALTNSMKKITGNNEFQELVKTLGINFSKENSAANMTHEYVVIMTDQDVDGAHIKGLWLAFFQKFVPDIFDLGKLWILDTPIKVAKNAKEELIKPFFTEQEFLDYLKKGNKPSIVEYKKGLGSFNEKEYKDVFEKVAVEDCLYKMLPPDEEDLQLMIDYLDDDAAPRKDLIKEYMKNFDINAI